MFGNKSLTGVANSRSLYTDTGMTGMCLLTNCMEMTDFNFLLQFSDMNPDPK